MDGHIIMSLHYILIVSYNTVGSHDQPCCVLSNFSERHSSLETLTFSLLWHSAYWRLCPNNARLLQFSFHITTSQTPEMVDL